MTTRLARQVAAFMDRHGQYLPIRPIKPSEALALFRHELMFEELEEFYRAIPCPATGKKGSLVEMVDALADLMYVVQGTALAFGVDLGPILDEVHRSNQTKTPGEKSTRGKILRGPDYSPPDIAGELSKQGWKP